jgi:uncharacterized protein
MGGPWTDVVPLAAAMLAAGAIGGLIAGLLGVGGGIVVVPVLEFALSRLGIDGRITMNIAVATSMATIVPTSISSSRAHAARGSVDFAIVRRWALPLVTGALGGAVIASRIDSRSLRIVFACVALVVAARMLLPQREESRRAWGLPGGLRGAWLPAGIGIVSSLMGIGGGTVSVPVMTIGGLPIHRAVGTAALLGLWISVPATIGFLFAQPAIEPPLLTAGYVNVIGFALIAPVSWLLAPLGSRMAHRLSRSALSAVFGGFLLIVALRMFYRSMA